MSAPPTFFVTSDLHYGLDPKGDANTEDLALTVEQQGADALLLAGDLGVDEPSIRACLQLFGGFRGVKLVVPGNHDIWTSVYDLPDDEGSMQIHDHRFPRLCEDCGFHPLHRQPFRLNDEVAFVGSMGWYDYSFADPLPGASIENYLTKIPPGMTHPVWNDARHARFGLSDQELTVLLNERLKEHLAEVADATAVVGLTHHLVSKALLFQPRFMLPDFWRFANAFLGSECFLSTFRESTEVSLVFSGHIHHPRTVQRNGITLCSVGSDYKKKELILATPQRILHHTIYRNSRG